MRGLQLAAAILTIISGAFAVLGGLLTGIIGDLARTATTTTNWGAILTAIGVIELLLGILMIVFGSLFCKPNAKKWVPIAIILLNILTLVFGFVMSYAVGAGSLRVGAMDVIGWIIPIFVIVVCIMYLFKSKKQPKKSA